MVGKALAKSGGAVVDYLSADGTMSAAALECGVTSAATEEADQRGGKHDQREGHVEHEDRDERQRGKTAHDVVLQGTRTHPDHRLRSEEHTSELQSLMRISYAVFCLKKKNITKAPQE